MESATYFETHLIDMESAAHSEPAAGRADYN